MPTGLCRSGMAQTLICSFNQPKRVPAFLDTSISEADLCSHVLHRAVGVEIFCRRLREKIARLRQGCSRLANQRILREMCALHKCFWQAISIKPSGNLRRGPPQRVRPCISRRPPARSWSFRGRSRCVGREADYGLGAVERVLCNRMRSNMPSAAFKDLTVG